MAFNSKNLHYEKNEPAFLRKLRGEHGGDRQNFQAARPKRGRMINDDDDSPAMVDEEGATVSKEDYQAMIKGGDKKSGAVNLEDLDDKKSEKDDNGTQTVPSEKQKVADVGAARKRKQVKVIGEVGEQDGEIEEKDPKPVKKPKKKVKLSFDATES